MAESREVELRLTAVVIKKKKQVLFIEADHEFTDILMSFLTLPLGTIVRLLRRHYEKGAPILGCLNSLYHSLENMDANLFWTEYGKLMLLKPISSFSDECDQLAINIDDTPSRQIYLCCNCNCMTMYFNTISCSCGLKIRNKIPMEDFHDSRTERTTAGLFTKPFTPFMITDDFHILLNNSESCLEVQQKNGVIDTDKVEKVPFHVGFHQILTLLERSLMSKTPISDIVFGTRKGMKDDYAPSFVTSPNDGKVNFPKMKVTVIIQTSTRRILFIQSDDSFVDFSFSLLTIPLGSVHYLCDGNCGFQNMANLYNSVLQLDPTTYFKEESIVDRLKNPELRYGYKTMMQILPVKEEKPPKLRWWHYLRLRLPYKVKNIDPKGGATFLKSPNSFITSEDLVVSSTAGSFIISALNEMKIPRSDVREEVLEIGVEEASSLLKATLRSRRALTDGLKYFLP